MSTNQRPSAAPANQDFLPAAHWHVLTPLYELVSRPVLGSVWRGMVEDVDRLTSRDAAVVDLGCGPGTVLSALAARRPDLQLTGVDIDPRMLAIAGKRLPHATLRRGSIDQVAIADQSADMVFSSMVFHHLDRTVKQGTFREAMRIVKPGGVFLLCDFAVPVSALGRLLLWSTALLESGAGRQGAGELIDIATAEALIITPRWTRFGCITQHEVRQG